MHLILQRYLGNGTGYEQADAQGRCAHTDGQVDRHDQTEMSKVNSDGVANGNKERCKDNNSTGLAVSFLCLYVFSKLLPDKKEDLPVSA